MSMKPELTLARAHMMKGREGIEIKTIRQENGERKWSQAGGESLCHWSVCVCVCVCVMCRFSVKRAFSRPTKISSHWAPYLFTIIHYVMIRASACLCELYYIWPIIATPFSALSPVLVAYLLWNIPAWCWYWSFFKTHTSLVLLLDLFLKHW
jgi:hypothetical protein